MNIIAFTTNFRNFDNYADAMRIVEERGGTCEIIALPWTGDPSHVRFSECGFKVRLMQPIAELSEKGIPIESLRKIARMVTDLNPDFFLVCDMQSYPSREMHRLLQEAGYRGKCIGLQHGLFQIWNLYNRNFCADYLFCFGQRHVDRLLPKYRSRAFAVGLPKLDRLKNVPTTRSGYITFLPQRSPEPEVIDPALAAYEAAVKTPIVIHDHPQYPSKYRHKPRIALPAVLNNRDQWGLIDYVRHANMVITLHSTAAIEALYLGKPVVLLPNAGLAAFENYPGISEGFSPRAIHDAAGKLVREVENIRIFLEDAVGGLRFDHSERVVEALRSLLECPEYNHAGAPHLQAALDNFPKVKAA